MNVSGSTVDFPIRVDARGTIVTTARREDVIEQAIGDIIETRRGERMMLPDYGIDDYVFASVDAAFAHRFAAHLESQIVKYVPLVRSANVTVSIDETGRCEAHVAFKTADTIEAPKNLVFPVWRYES